MPHSYIRHEILYMIYIGDKSLTLGDLSSGVVITKKYRFVLNCNLNSYILFSIPGTTKRNMRNGDEDSSSHHL